jgi:hypothetical protein
MNILDISSKLYDFDAHVAESLNDEIKDKINLSNGIIKFKVIDFDLNYFEYERCNEISRKIDYAVESICDEIELNQIDENLRIYGLKFSDAIFNSLFRAHTTKKLFELLSILGIKCYFLDNKLYLFNKISVNQNVEYAIYKYSNNKFNEVLFEGTESECKNELNFIYDEYVRYGSYSVQNIYNGEFNMTNFEDGEVLLIKIMRV